ncbi:MAG: hypothetical protein KAJ19_21480 [Gammaproteobacteria bacterium]|nr:hypothetical protein [Gammaproteobacteria bacterium]
MGLPSTIAGLNQLPLDIKRETYAKIIPPDLLEMFGIQKDLLDSQGNDLFQLNCHPGSTDVELALFHSDEARDPIIFGHLTDTIHGQLHILLYGMNDINSQRFDVDQLPVGTKTNFGYNHRNLEAEIQALNAGLAPGQIYQGPRLFQQSLKQFESFVACMGQDIFFVEPLYYHVALIFENYKFQYQSGKKLMDRIYSGFSQDGDLIARLNGSNPFRQPKAAAHLRLRSWAVHDNILGEPFSNVTMYKYIDKDSTPCSEVTLPW